MHRMIPLMPVALVALVGATSLTACSSIPDQPPQETVEVETLRLRIGQVRDAIDETRQTVARSQGAPYLPELYMRLAELLSEEARYHYQLARQRERGEAQADLYVPEVRLLKNEAIEIYERTLRRFPDSPQAPRILFNLGHEHRELGNFDEMREAMQRVVAEYPDSSLTPQALIVLGDYEFDRFEMGEAAYWYEQIIDEDRGLNAASGLAHYKMAWVAINEGECGDALDQFESAMESASRWQEGEGDRRGVDHNIEGLPGADRAIDVHRNSLVDLAYCYSQERDADEALDYFRTWATNRTNYLAGLSRLTRRYRILDEFAGARDVSRELLRYGTAEFDRLEDARTLFTALNELGDYSAIDDDVALINNAITRYHGQIAISADESQGLFEEFELYVRDLATRAQAALDEAGDDERQELADRTVQAYRTHLHTYPTSPERAAMLLNLVEVLELREEHFEAGQRGLQAAPLLEEDEARRDALYDAVVNFQAALEQESNRIEFESVVARTSIRSAGQELLRLGLESDRERQVKFAIGESHYDAGEFDEAIDKLGLVAYQYPGTEQGEEAIRLVLDSYLTLNDFDGLIAASQRFLGAGSPASSELQAEISTNLEVAEQRRLDALTLAAAGDDDIDLTPLMDFAEVHQGTETGERALLNAFVAARSSGNTALMYEMADQLAAAYPQSDELSGIFSSLAQTAARRFEYERAVHYLERAGQADPGQRARMLIAAGELMEEVGQYDQARDHYRDAISAAEGSETRARAAANYAILLERNSTPQQLARALRPYEEDGHPELLVRLGLAELGLGNSSEAAGYFQRVLGSGTASAEAEARAHYGLAEVMLATLQTFPSLDDFMIIQDYITLIDVTQQNYLNAARQRSQRYTTASFARLAFALQYVVRELQSVTLPSDISADQRQALQTAIDSRIERISETADEALDACSSRLWNAFVFDDTVRRCLQGQPWEAVLVTYSSQQPRRTVDLGEPGEALRDRIARNPEDVGALRELGEMLLDRGDPHLARLAFQQAVNSGGGGTEMNLVGIASYQTGDLTGAFQAFGRAADAGEAAAKSNLARLLRENGQQALAEELSERFSAEREGGREL